MFFSWAQGFMSGVNAYSAVAMQTYKDLSARGVKEQEGFFLDYCKKHPRDRYMDAVAALQYTLPSKDAR
ncbi:MAG: hypothetical protein Q8M26_04960 [Pseudolabrys sp.]|nr:hypothetical protein [Pseudolabrys sp.]